MAYNVRQLDEVGKVIKKNINLNQNIMSTEKQDSKTETLSGQCSVRERFLPHGLRIDSEGLVRDIDGTYLEKCDKCGEYCLPEIVINLECICEDCKNAL